MPVVGYIQLPGQLMSAFRHEVAHEWFAQKQ
jgi:hypothetical protein